MRKVKVYMHDLFSGVLFEIKKNEAYRFEYEPGYNGPPVSLTMPVEEQQFSWQKFPPFFEGLLPEGIMLEGLLRQLKIDRNDCLSQLIATGADLVGAVTVKPFTDE